jgi:predicted flavoprotein YhiN
LRDEIEATGTARLTLDLLPDKPADTLAEALTRGRGARSFMNHLREHTGLHGAKAGLLREGLDVAAWNALTQDPAALAARIEALPLTLGAARPLAEAISSAGGVRLGARRTAMLRAHPGVACAGEMSIGRRDRRLLLTACFASGVVAARGLLAWWGARAPA